MKNLNLKKGQKIVVYSPTKSSVYGGTVGRVDSIERSVRLIKIELENNAPLDGVHYQNVWFYNLKTNKIRYDSKDIEDSDWIIGDIHDYDTKVLKSMERPYWDNPDSLGAKPINRIGFTEMDGKVVLDNPYIKTFNLNNEENNMNRRTIKIELFDVDKALDVQYSLVASFDNVLTEDNIPTTIQELIMNEDIAGFIKKHNEVRASKIDLSILKSRGKKVKLSPIKLKDLVWSVDGIYQV